MADDDLAEQLPLAGPGPVAGDEFAGIEPTGRAVRVPYSVVYDLRDDRISALRIYFPMSLLMEQLSG